MENENFDSKTVEIRERKREGLKEHRSVNRTRVLNGKRLHLDAVEVECQDLTIEQVKVLSEKWRKSKGDRSLVVQLKRAFGYRADAVQTFLKVGGALGKLVGALTGNDCDLQLEAAACFVNLFLAEHDVIKGAVRDTIPYLMTYLNGSSSPLKELCLWALGNIAADCHECCQSLKAQNFVQSILSIIRIRVANEQISPNDDPVLHSALFALVRYMTNMPHHWSDILAAGFSERLPWLVDNKFAATILEEASTVTFYLSTREEHMDYLIHSGCIGRAVSTLQYIIFMTDQECSASIQRHIRIVTFLVRTLADVSAKLDGTQVADCWQNASSIIHQLLLSNIPHLQKETLWLLANLTAVNLVTGDLYSKKSGVLENVVQMLFNPVSPSRGIALQCLKCLCNALTTYDIPALSNDIRGCLTDRNIADFLDRCEPEERRYILALLAMLRMAPHGFDWLSEKEFPQSRERLLRLSVTAVEQATSDLAAAVLECH